MLEITLLLAVIGDMRHLSLHVLPIPWDGVPSTRFLTICCSIGASLSPLLPTALSTAIYKPEKSRQNIIISSHPTKSLWTSCSAQKAKEIFIFLMRASWPGKPVRTYSRVPYFHRPRSLVVAQPGWIHKTFLHLADLCGIASSQESWSLSSSRRSLELNRSHYLQTSSAVIASKVSPK